MVEQYWELFAFSLAGTVICVVMLVLCFIFAKKLFLNKKYGVVGLVLLSALLALVTALSVHHFILCCKDYSYVSDNTYIEAKAEMIEYTSVEKDWDADGSVRYREPKFFLPEQNEYVILYTKDVEVGETYLIRYYPNTRICEIVDKVS